MNLPTHVRSMLKYAIFTLSLLVLLGMLLSSYSAIKYIAIGAVVFLGLLLDFTYFNLRWSLILLVAAPCLWLGYRVYLGLGFPSVVVPLCGTGDLKSALELTGYAAEVEPVDLSDGSFSVNEHIVYKEWEAECNYFNEWEYTKVVQEAVEQDLPSRIVQSTKSGWFLHEVIIPNKLSDFDCCPSEASALIKSLPYNSFYDAQYATDLNVDEYLGVETISWKTSDLDADLRFAYLPPPFYNIRGLVSPFIDLAKNENWILAAVGSVITSIVLFVLKPTVFDAVKDKFKSLFNKDDPTTPPKPPMRRKNRNQ